MDWSGVLIAEDTRHTYGERRFVAFGMIEQRLHCLVFVRREAAVRVISLRKANRREQITYAKKIHSSTR